MVELSSSTFGVDVSGYVGWTRKLLSQKSRDPSFINVL